MFLLEISHPNIRDGGKRKGEFETNIPSICRTAKFTDRTREPL
jgi:hypothetical protein